MKISKYLNDHKENLKVNLVNISSAGIRVFHEVILVTSTCNYPSRSVRYKPNLKYDESTPPPPYKLHPNLYELAQVGFCTLLGIKEFPFRYLSLKINLKESIKAKTLD